MQYQEPNQWHLIPVLIVKACWCPYNSRCYNTFIAFEPNFWCRPRVFSLEICNLKWSFELQNFKKHALSTDRNCFKTSRNVCKIDVIPKNIHNKLFYLRHPQISSWTYLFCIVATSWHLEHTYQREDIERTTLSYRPREKKCKKQENKWSNESCWSQKRQLINTFKGHPPKYVYMHMHIFMFICIFIYHISLATWARNN